MKLPAIIDDFSRGEISPLLLAKLSSSEVRNGLSSAINMIPDPRGPMVGRQGFKHLAEIEATDLHATLFDFEMYEGKSLCIVFYDDKVVIANISTGEMTTATFTTPYSAELLHGASRNRHRLASCKSPDGTRIYFVHPSVAPYEMIIADDDPVSDTVLDVTFQAVSFTDMPAEWTGDNYPTTITFFQDRTWWGGCKENPETFWGSKSSEHTVMTLGTAADDAVKFVLQKEGLIKWMSGHSSLLIGTSWGEFIASGSNVTIEPNDIQIDPQSAYGSMQLQPEFIGDEVLYVSTDGRKLRSMWWRWLESGWTSIDLTYSGEHLTSGGIKDIAYCRDPYSQIWMLTATDNLIVCSYRRKNDQEPVVGWAQIVPSEAIDKIVGMCSVEDMGRSTLVVAAQVTVDGSPALHLMRQDALDPYSDELVTLDNYSTHTPVNRVISGLEYLEGEEISLIGDGAVLPMETVTDGEITLDADYTTVHVGHSYLQQMVTLPYFIYEKQQAHPMKRWNKIWTFIHNSFPPKINGNRASTRYPGTPMGQGEEPFSGLVQVNSTGWDRMAQITIEQDIPMPLIVLGVYGEVNVETI